MVIPTGAPLIELIELIDRLRSPGGCPWDAEQTHESLVTHLIEETYEAVEAIETDDPVGIREELGDVLLQVIFHARIGQEADLDPWSIDDVAAGVIAKLVSRHPHVFGDETAESAAQVEANWLARKKIEKDRTSVLDGLPAGLSTLLLAAKLQDRARLGGISTPPSDASSVEAARAALNTVGDSGVGGLLAALVEQSIALGVDPDAALRAQLREFDTQVREAEGQLARAYPTDP